MMGEGGFFTQYHNRGFDILSWIRSSDKMMDEDDLQKRWLASDHKGIDWKKNCFPGTKFPFQVQERGDLSIGFFCFPKIH